jgi:hypothetical protein
MAIAGRARLLQAVFAGVAIIALLAFAHALRPATGGIALASRTSTIVFSPVDDDSTSDDDAQVQRQMLQDQQDSDEAEQQAEQQNEQAQQQFNLDEQLAESNDQQFIQSQQQG